MQYVLILVVSLVASLLSVPEALAQCDPTVSGPFTLASQEPSDCNAYLSGSIFNMELPADKLDHKDPNSQAIAVGLITRGLFTFQLKTPGTIDDSHTGPVYGGASDPIWKIPAASCGVCGTPGTPSYAGDTYFHAPNGTRWTNRSGNSGDSFVDVYDQVYRVRIQLYKSSGPANNTFTLGVSPSGCTGVSEATACNVPSAGYGAQRLSIDAVGSDLYQLPNSGGDSLKSANQALMIRHEEMLAGEINHAVYINSDCENTGAVFPAIPVAGGQAIRCVDIGKSSIAATSLKHGQLIFLDYTEAEINAMLVPGPHKTILKALSKYGGYQGDTSTSAVLQVQRLEGLEPTYVAEGWVDSTPIATVRAGTKPGSQFLDLMLDSGYTCSALEPTTLCKIGIDLENTPSVNGMSIGLHLHVADECIARGMAGLSGGCYTPPSLPDVLSFTVQPTTADVDTVISPAITVQIKDSTGVNQSDSGIVCTASLVPVSLCAGALLGDTTQATNGSGLCTFNDLTITEAGGCKLNVSAPSITSALSNLFDITNDPGSAPVGSVSIDGTPGVTNSGSNVSDQSHSLTVGNNPNRYLLACTGTDTGGLTSDTATINGVAMTLVGRGFSPAGGVSASMWRSLAPAVGSTTINHSVGFAAKHIVNAISLYGVNPVAPLRDVDTDDATESGEATGSTLTLTSNANDLLVGCACAGRDADPVNMVPGAGFTERSEGSAVSAPSDIRCAMATRVAAGSTVASVWTWTNTVNFAHVAATVVPEGTISLTPITTSRFNNEAITWDTTLTGTYNVLYSVDGGTRWIFADTVLVQSETYTPPSTNQSGIRQQFDGMKVCISDGLNCTDGTAYAASGPFEMKSVLSGFAP